MNSSNQLNGAYAYSGVAAPWVCPTSNLNETYCDWVLDLYGINIGDVIKTDIPIRQHWTSFSQFVDQRFS